MACSAHELALHLRELGKGGDSHSAIAAVVPEDVEFWTLFGNVRVQAFVDWLMNGVNEKRSIEHELSSEELMALKAAVSKGPLLKGKELCQELEAMGLKEDSQERKDLNASIQFSVKMATEKLHRLQKKKEILERQVSRSRERYKVCEENLSARQAQKSKVERDLISKKRSLNVVLNAMEAELNSLRENQSEFGKRQLWQLVQGDSEFAGLALDRNGSTQALIDKSRNLLELQLAAARANSESNLGSFGPSLEKLQRARMALAVEEISTASFQAQLNLLRGSQVSLCNEDLLSTEQEIEKQIQILSALVNEHLSLRFQNVRRVGESQNETSQTPLLNYLAQATKTRSEVLCRLKDILGMELETAAVQQKLLIDLANLKASSVSSCSLDQSSDHNYTQSTSVLPERQSYHKDGVQNLDCRSQDDDSSLLLNETIRMLQAVSILQEKTSTILSLESDVSLAHKSLELHARQIFDDAFQVLSKKASLDQALVHDDQLKVSRMAFVQFYKNLNTYTTSVEEQNV